MDPDGGNDENDQSVWNYRRNLAGFWILGLTNNFAYVVMLSAAEDILRDEANSTESHNETHLDPTVTDYSGISQNLSGKLVPECNKIGTGAVLLADILPTLLIKLVAPFIIHLVPYNVRVAAVILSSSVSFLIVSLAGQVWLSLLGVVFASMGAGFGEITFLALSAHFNKNVVSTWSSGTGAAGVCGALSYAGLTALGVTPRTTLLIMLLVPGAMAGSYFLLLVKAPSVYFGIQPSTEDTEETPILQEEVSLRSSAREKLESVIPLFKYMVPLALVYFAEYFINQALFELVYFKHIWLPAYQQYRWYQVIYQIGVFLSRSSVNLFQIAHLWILPILQFGNIALILCQIFFQFIPNIWIVFVIILYEGLLGGWGYVNTFYKISKEVPEEKREFSMAVASVADSFGITIAGIISVPVHNLICDL